MRLTLVTRIFLPEPSAASQRLGALARSLAEHGDQVTVLTSEPLGPQREEPVPGGYRIRRWPVLRDRSGYVRGYLPYASFDVPAFFRVLFGQRTDLVVVEPPPTTGLAVRLACALRRIPYAYYAADIWSIAAESTGAPAPILRFVRWMERRAMRGAVLCIAVSDGVAAQIRSLAPNARIVVVGHGVDTAVFDADVKPLAERDDIVYLGTASEWHGADIFIEALALLREEGSDVPVVFVGQGSEWNLLQRLAHERGVGDLVTFSSAEPPQRAARRLRAARAALASLRPGIGYDFAVPTKSYSALAVGTPVLYAGPAHVANTIAENGLGWGCAYDVREVADALREARSSAPGERERHHIAEWTRQHASADAVATATVEALHAALPRRGGRRKVPPADGGKLMGLDRGPL